MRIKSTQDHQFSQVPKAEIQRSSFDRSFGHKTTFDAGYLIPIMVDEALPGDTFNVKLTAFARLATPIKPIMDNIHMETFFFAVPYRLVWDNWQKFNGEQTSPGDSTDYVIPQLTIPVGGYLTGSVPDYMGIPINKVGMSISSLPFRAYYLIWNEWFRDQNLQDSILFSLGNGPDAFGEMVFPVRRGKRHDYFTSALPWPQKGPTVDVPIGTNAPVIRNDAATAIWLTDGAADKAMGTGGAGVGWKGATDWAVPNVGLSWGKAADGSFTGLTADLSTATAATINQLREAFQIQRMYERDARGGTRYTEILKAHFGVTSPDARLQRPEYLGGGSSYVNINPIPQQSSTDATTPQGNLSAMGTGQINGHGFTKSFTEHCIIIGLICARADLTYQQGLNKMWSRSTRFDFYWPALSHLGEQAILNKEIYAQGTADDELVFGYQERYAEYRYKPSMITGVFRSDAAASLDIWHLAQDFTALPVLNDAFIQENPPIDRVIAVPSEPHFLFDSYFDMKCARPMPLYGVPGMIDHF